MSISIAPLEVRDTVVGGVQVSEKEHLVLFQATVCGKGPNCLLFPVPAMQLARNNVIVARRTPNILRDMSARLRRLDGATVDNAGMARVRAVCPVTVTIAQKPDAIPSALGRANPELLPRLHTQFVNWLDTFSAAGTFVLISFIATNEEQVLPPIIVRYEPTMPWFLYAPGVVAHDGTVPELEHGDPHRDIKVVFGAVEATTGIPVTYQDKLTAKLQPLLPTRVVGFHDTWLPNLDYDVKLENVLNGYSGVSLAYTLVEHEEHRLS